MLIYDFCYLVATMRPQLRLALFTFTSLVFTLPLYAAEHCEVLSAVAELNTKYFEAFWIAQSGHIPQTPPVGSVDSVLPRGPLPLLKRGLIRDPYLEGHSGQKIFAGDFFRRLPDSIAPETAGIVQNVFVDGDGNSRALIIEREVLGNKPVINRLLALHEHADLFLARHLGPSVEDLFSKGRTFVWPSLINNSPVGNLKEVPSIVIEGHRYAKRQLVSYQSRPTLPRKLGYVSFLVGASNIDHIIFVTDEVAPSGEFIRMVLSPAQMRTLRPVAALPDDASPLLALRYLGQNRLIGANGLPMKAGDKIYFNGGGFGASDILSWDSAGIESIDVAPVFDRAESRIDLAFFDSHPLSPDAQDRLKDDPNLMHYDRWLESAAALTDAEAQARLSLGIENGLLGQNIDSLDEEPQNAPNDYFRRVIEILPNEETFTGSLFRQHYIRRPQHLSSHLNIEHWIRKYPDYTRLYGMRVDRDSLLIPDAAAFSAYFHRVHPDWRISFVDESYHPRATSDEKGLDFGRKFADGKLPYNALLPVQSLMIPLIGKQRLALAQSSAQFLVGVWESIPKLRQVATAWLWSIREWYFQAQFELSMNFDVETPHRCLQGLSIMDTYQFAAPSPKAIFDSQLNAGPRLPQRDTTAQILRPLNGVSGLVQRSDFDVVPEMNLSVPSIYRVLNAELARMNPEAQTILSFLRIQSGVDEMPALSLGEVLANFEMLNRPPPRTFP